MMDGRRSKFSGAFDQIRQGANAYHSAGLVLSLPLANIAARNTYKGGKVAKEVALLRLTEKQQDIITEVDNAVRPFSTRIDKSWRAAKLENC